MYDSDLSPLDRKSNTVTNRCYNEKSTTFALKFQSLTANEDRKKNSDTNCKYFDNRTALNHNNLPPAFDLEDLVIAGEQREACPYYAARAMAKVANIVFCPYNYLIDPSIRSSVRIIL